MQLRRSSRSTDQQKSPNDMSSDGATVVSANSVGPNNDENQSPVKEESVDADVNENDSDTGSDIFMPGGITIKATAISENIQNVKEKCDEDNSEKTDEESNCEKNNSGEEQVLSDEKSNQNTSCEKDEQQDIEEEKMDAGYDDEDSRSSCLQINTDTPEPDGDKAESKNDKLSSLSPEITKERNIFDNSDIFSESLEEKSEKVKEEVKTEDEDDEHNISDDFKIGQQEKDSIEDDEEPDDGVTEPPCFENVESNIYLIDKKKSRLSKEVRRMICECPYEPDDPLFLGCGDDCLNRLLMIECHTRCPTGEFCTNRNFQRGCNYNLEIFKAGKKGWGLRTNEPIQKGSFIIEYCGEVVDYNEFHNRTLQYDAEKMTHYYFMTLKTNEIIDATKKGCKSRFINHSCDPNSVTQKWTVNGFLRVGFFALRYISAGEELSFDYQFQRYGEKPQNCYCGAMNCRGVIGTEQVNSFPIYMEKMISDSPSMSSKQKKRKKQMKEFYDSALADELNELLGTKWELKESKHSLELLRLMVKVETLHERKELLKILQSSRDTSALKAFVRYKGLSLLWTWMVDASEDKHKYKVEILKTLKHLPIPNKNELDDSKLSTIVIKWASAKQEEGVKRESGSDDESQSPSDNEVKNDEGGSTSQDESSKEEEAEGKNSGTSLEAESMEEGEILENEDASSNKKAKKKDKITRKKERGDARKRDIASLSATLLEDWKLLKEVFRIPKKSQTPDRRPKAESEDSPIPEEKRLNNKGMDSPSQTNTLTATVGTPPSSKTVLPDSTFRSPSNKQKPTQLYKGGGLLSTYSSESADSPSSSSQDRGDDPKNTNEKNSRRGWRKSPTSTSDQVEHSRSGSDSSDRNVAADSTNNSRGDGDADSTWTGGSDTRDSRRDSGWSRNRGRRRSYDNDNRGWNDRENDSYSGGEGERHRGNWNSTNRGRNRWNDRHNRGGRQHADRGYQGASDESNGNSWRKHGRDFYEPPKNMQHHQQFGNLNMVPNMPPNMMPVMMNRMPNQMRMPMFQGNGNNSTIMGQPPNQMLPQHPMSGNAPGIFPPNRLPPRPPGNPQINTMMPNQLPHSSPLVSPMSASPFNTAPLPPPKPVGQYSSPAQPEVSALNVVNQLQLLLNAERLKQAQELNNTKPETPDFSRSSTSGSNSPTRTKVPAVLPPHWKTATDSEGRMYYYHAITRETSWDPPMHIEEEDTKEEIPPKKIKKRHSTEDPRSPPQSKQSPRIAAADTTHHHGPRTPPGPHSSHGSSAHKVREAFKAKMSSVVVNCLNAYQKVDCKQGRIKNIDDFKFLARKLTHGLIMKEIQRIKGEERLICNDSVKVKVKEYIRNYMKKFGPCYIRS